MEKLEFSCCFCNQGIIENKTDPLDVNIMQNDDVQNNTRTSQSFYAHFYCFKEKLHHFPKTYFIKFEDDDEPEIDLKTINVNAQYLIQKIIELENVDRWKVIYYGLECGRIDSQFVMNYCYVLIEQNCYVDKFVLDIPGFTNKNDFNNFSKLIGEKIDNAAEIMIDKIEYYFKIWSYLTLAADMIAEKIIK